MIHVYTMDRCLSLCVRQALIMAWKGRNVGVRLAWGCNSSCYHDYFSKDMQ